MFAAGAHGSFDAFGIHPYTYPFAPDEPAPTTTSSTWGMYYDLMVANGDSDKQVWSTEAGAPTGTFVGSPTAAPSGRGTASAHRPSGSTRSPRPARGWVRCSGSASATTPPRRHRENFGILRNDFTPKPAYDAFVASMQLPI